MKEKNLIKGYIFVALSAVIFGLMPLMAKFIYNDGLNPVSLVFFRNCLSLPVLAILSLATGGSLKIKPSAIPQISLIAIVGCCITPLLLFTSYNYIPSGTATVLHFIYPAVVVIAEFFISKGKMPKGHIISVVICIIGISMFYNPNDGINLTGALIALASGVTYALYIIFLSGFKNKKMSMFTFSFFVALICALVMLIVCIITKALTFPHSLSGWLLTILFALSLNVGAVVLFQQGTFLIGGGRASILSTFEPITSIFAGVIIFKEGLNLFTILGTILVVGASVMIAVYDMKKK